MALDIPDTSVCLNCRYLLRGLENPVCPECGRRFDPEDRATYTDQNHRGTFFRWSHPPRHWLRYAMMVGTVAILIMASEPGYFLIVPEFTARCRPQGWLPRDAQTRIFYGMMVIAFVIALQHFAMWRLTRKLMRRNAPPPISRLMKWWWAPLCLALVLSASIYPWPLWIRFKGSRASLEVVAKQQLAVGTGTHGLHFCGAYVVHGPYIYSGGKQDVAYLQVEGTRNAGFIYSPDPTWERDFAYRLSEHWHYTRHWGGRRNWP